MICKSRMKRKQWHSFHVDLWPWGNRKMSCEGHLYQHHGGSCLSIAIASIPKLAHSKQEKYRACCYCDQVATINLWHNRFLDCISREKPEQSFQKACHVTESVLIPHELQGSYPGHPWERMFRSSRTNVLLSERSDSVVHIIYTAM